MIKTAAAVVTSVVISTGITYYMMKPVKTQLQFTPKVAVVDYIRMGDGVFFNGNASASEKERIQSKIEVAKHNLEMLQDAGYLVLDRTKILAAPDFAVKEISGK